MNRVLILVEGQTEEAFVRNVLAPGLWPHGVSPAVTVVATKRLMAGGTFRGGVVSYEQVVSHVRRLLGDTGARLVTTMLDLYQLPGDFPGRSTCPAGRGQSKAEHFEKRFAEDVGNPRFRPYLSVHEFEALLFAGLDACGRLFQSEHAVASLQAQRSAVPTAEDINDGDDTAPSRRIARAFPSYHKLRHGPIAAKLIGLPRLREQCPHFSAWVRDLERAGSPTPVSSTG